MAMKTGICWDNRVMASWTAEDIFSSGPMIVPSKSRAAAKIVGLVSIISLRSRIFIGILYDLGEFGYLKKERPPENPKALLFVIYRESA